MTNGHQRTIFAVKKQMHVWPKEWEEIGDTITANVVIEAPGIAGLPNRMELWYRLPAEHRSAIITSADPFVIATLFLAMQNSVHLNVHGEVSPSLLRNLEEFQDAWSAWLPGEYSKIEIHVDAERENLPQKSERAIVAFSGGLDSSFSALRHSQGLCGRWRRNVAAGLLVHGLDIPLDDVCAMEKNVGKAKTALDRLGLTLIPLATNFRAIVENWEDSHGAAIASCLTMLARGHTTGLIGNTWVYSSLRFPWGSNPISDPLMSSDTFTIVHDGAGFSRTEKVRQIAQYPELANNLRVCWQGRHRDRNCGHCEKCIRTILDFRVTGHGLPLSFPHDVTDDDIDSLSLTNPAHLVHLKGILAEARRISLTGSWLDALQHCVNKNSHLEHQYLVNTGFRQKLKRIPFVRLMNYRLKKITGKL
jgi:hypothetical protein